MLNGTGIIVKFGVDEMGEVVEVKMPESETVAIDTSHHQTYKGKTYIAGDLVENGNLTLTLAYLPSASLVIGATDTVTVTFPTAEVGTFTGFVQKLAPETPLEDRMVETVTFKVSGNITWV